MDDYSIIKNDQVYLDGYGWFPFKSLVFGPIKTEKLDEITLVVKFTINFGEYRVNFITMLNEKNNGGNKWVLTEGNGHTHYYCLDEKPLHRLEMDRISGISIIKDEVNGDSCTVNEHTMDDNSDGIKSLLYLDNFSRGNYTIHYKVWTINSGRTERYTLHNRILNTHFDEGTERLTVAVDAEAELVNLLIKCLDEHIIKTPFIDVVVSATFNSKLGVTVGAKEVSDPVDIVLPTLKVNVATKPILFSYIGDVEVDGFTVISGSNINTIKLAESIAGVILDSRNFIHLHKQLNSIVEYNNYALYFLWDGEKLDSLTHIALKNVVKTTYENLD